MPNSPVIVLVEDNLGDARWFWKQMLQGGVLCDVTIFNTDEAAWMVEPIGRSSSC
jgi:hypothetical protein